MASNSNKQTMREDEILADLCADDLSDVPVEANEESSESENDSDIPVSKKGRKNHSSIISDSESSEISEDEVADSGILDTWIKRDVKVTLEKFEGTPGVKIKPKHIDSISEAVELFLGDDFFQMMCDESNLYYSQNKDKYKLSPKSGKWSDITVPEMKKFLSIIILMGQVRKTSLKEYWTTDPFISTPIFRQLMSRNRFEYIWKAWHFNNNELYSKETSERLFKIRPIVDYIVDKCQTVYKPKQELSLDEAMIPWRGRLKFRTYNPAKIVKYGLLVRMVCESESGYISNLEIYAAEGKKLEETILSVLKPSLNQWHHIYQDNYYNSVKVAESLLAKKTRVCGTIRANRGLPDILKKESKKLKKGEYTFCRKGQVLLLNWKDKREVRMITTIHDASMSNARKINNITGLVVKKPNCIVKYNDCMKGVDRADMYLAYYTILRKTMKWSKKVVLWLINCALFNSFRVYKTLNKDSKIRFKQFLLGISKEWAESSERPRQGDEPSAGEPSGDKETDVKEPTQRTPKEDHPARLSGDLATHSLEPIVGIGKKKYHTRVCKVCSSKKLRSETRYICKFCRVPLHKGACFLQYHTKKDY
jgi:hypothetical protein